MHDAVTGIKTVSLNDAAPLPIAVRGAPAPPIRATCSTMLHIINFMHVCMYVKDKV